jgi:hypothetical protein
VGTISVRLPPAVSAEIDAYLEELRAQMPLLPGTDAVRQPPAPALQERKKSARRR